MVCIPCIVIPVLLWVYKRFLEPIIYPVIQPFITRFWKSKPPLEQSAHKTVECNGEHNGLETPLEKKECEKKSD